MDIALIQPDQLSEAQLGAWRRIIAADANYDSPFFAPTFTAAVAQARTDVEIAVVQEDGESVGFVPFQRTSSRVGHPVGWKLNDFQGAILAPSVSIEPVDLLQACGLSQWRFDHLPTSQSWCSDAHIVRADSPVIELASGFDGYLKLKKAMGDSRLKTVKRKSRKLEREAGPLRLEFDSPDGAAFDALIQWKREQLRRTKAANIFATKWANDTVDVLRRSKAGDCRGLLSAIYAGESLVAAHFGIRNDRVLHWWITAYNPDFERYSPGAILLLQLAQACADAGIQRVDLGKGSEPYKRHFMTSATALAEGSIARTPWRRAQHRIAYRMMQSIRGSSRMRPVVQWMKRIRRSVARD